MERKLYIPLVILLCIEDEKMENQTVKCEIKLIRNPKVGKGWVYNLTKECWMRAVNPQFAKNGAVIRGTYIFREGEKYLVKVDESSWSNQWETYLLQTVKNGQVVTLAQWERDNGAYKFSDDKLQQHFINYSLTQPQTSDDPNQQTVKVNVLEFAKYLAKLI